MTTSIRYIVDNIPPAVTFYESLGFEPQVEPKPGFAMLRRGDLRLLLNTPGGGGGAGQPMDDGTQPQAGGWNRFLLEVDDIEATVDRLTAAGVSFRSRIISGT